MICSYYYAKTALEKDTVTHLNPFRLPKYIRYACSNNLRANSHHQPDNLLIYSRSYTREARWGHKVFREIEDRPLVLSLNPCRMKLSQ